VHCWHAVGSTAAEAYCFAAFLKEECRSMHVDLNGIHFNRKRLEAEAIAFVMIILFIVLAFAY
jgi:hypothetical protein